jgi:ABC-type transport system involved in multi-copper enzyme maturation permease subunit
MRNLLLVTKYTVQDLLRHKSFYAILVICVLFVLMLRSCYKGNYNVNGETIDNLTVAWHASRIAFQIISGGAMFIVILLSMGLLRRERDEGTMVHLLSKPVSRFQYAMGKAAGLWIVSFLFMFILHVTIFIITWINAGGIMPGYLTASLLCSINLLIMVPLVLLLSLFLPDIVAALASLGVIVVGFFSDSLFQAMHSSVLRQAIPTDMNTAPALWRILWPKTAALQEFATTIIGKAGEFHQMGPVHPIINVLMYATALFIVLILRFHREEL